MSSGRIAGFPLWRWRTAGFPSWVWTAPVPRQARPQALRRLRHVLFWPAGGKTGRRSRTCCPHFRNSAVGAPGVVSARPQARALWEAAEFSTPLEEILATLSSWHGLWRRRWGYAVPPQDESWRPPGEVLRTEGIHGVLPTQASDTSTRRGADTLQLLCESPHLEVADSVSLTAMLEAQEQDWTSTARELLGDTALDPRSLECGAASRQHGAVPRVQLAAAGLRAGRLGELLRAASRVHVARGRLVAAALSVAATTTAATTASATASFAVASRRLLAAGTRGGWALGLGIAPGLRTRRAVAGGAAEDAAPGGFLALRWLG